VYRGGEGYWAFILHRSSGIGVFLFLLLHIVDVALLGWGPDLYNRVLAFYDTLLFRVFELVLLAAVLFHALNGLRIMLFDFWSEGTRYQRLLFRLVAGAFWLLLLPTAYFLLRPLL
jgi:succinate dehydrogenase / fumarate reductase cytochrome b subunit